MGRYENALKSVQLRSLMQEGKYDEALKLAQQIEQTKINDVSELKLLADVYRKCGKYTEAKELYYEIYNELHTRKILYNLVLLCVKAGSLNEAESMYEEYANIDKKSVDRYILKYRIDKARKADRSEIIADLENIVREDYMEEWAYELAKQYHKAGLIPECIEECNNIILWFAESEISQKAEFLRAHYEGSPDSNNILEAIQNNLSDNVSKYMGEGPVAFLSVAQLFDKINSDEASLINIAMTSDEDEYLLVVIRKLNKQLQLKGYLENSRIAKVDSRKLNADDMLSQIDNLRNSCIIIENAYELSMEVIETILNLTYTFPSEMVFIFVDTRERINMLINREKRLQNIIKYYVQS